MTYSLSMLREASAAALRLPFVLSFTAPLNRHSPVGANLAVAPTG